MSEDGDDDQAVFKNHGHVEGVAFLVGAAPAAHCVPPNNGWCGPPANQIPCHSHVNVAVWYATGLGTRAAIPDANFEAITYKHETMVVWAIPETTLRWFLCRVSGSIPQASVTR